MQVDLRTGAAVAWLWMNQGRFGRWGGWGHRIVRCGWTGWGREVVEVGFFVFFFLSLFFLFVSSQGLSIPLGLGGMEVGVSRPHIAPLSCGSVGCSVG